ncbi:FGGY family carbohydrate kinase [Streptomyces sp. NPDC029080]|uniref:FGGY family carbohydrate kinase n=1 Tax=Streptomyces sp. NPDC029080 TaxID=3155017 RepID=UPI0033C8EB47
MTDTAGTYVAAIDQGTTSSRCAVFDHSGAIVAVDRREHRQIRPRPGWVEHDAAEIWSKVQAVVAGALARAGLRADRLSALGITNQRDTTVLWDRATGKPVHNALVRQDTRTAALCDELGGADGEDRFRELTGLSLAACRAGPKAAWLLDHVPGLRRRAESGEIAFGTVDSWLIWNLTGGADGGRHVTGVTNAARTMLMNLDTLRWDPFLLSALNVPEAVLPEIRSSAEVYGTAVGQLSGVPVASALVDQQAALFGQTWPDVGTGENTLKPDGVVPGDALLVRRQADVLGVPVIRPRVPEATCLGAACAAGVATGVWRDLGEPRPNWQREAHRTPATEAPVRDREYRNRRRAVEGSFGRLGEGGA